MNIKEIKRGEIYYYNFGANPGSIQCGCRPVLVLQADNFNQHAPTIIVAAITSVIKKQYMPSHIILPVDCGLPETSMVMLEQIRTVNKNELTECVARVDDEYTWKQINNAVKKTFGLWFYKTPRTGNILCLCPRCLDDYKSLPGTIVHRLDPFQTARDKCTLCDRLGYDYVIFDKRRQVERNSSKEGQHEKRRAE